MPIAAAPNYLGRDFKEASPALRFGLLLPVWTTRRDQEVDLNKRAEAKSREGDEVRALLQRGMDHAIAQMRDRKPKPVAGLWDKNDFAAREAWKGVRELCTADIQRMKALGARQTALAAPLSEGGRLLALDAVSTAPFTTGLGNEHPLENGFAFLNPYGLPYLPGSGVKGVLRQAARELVSDQWGEANGWTEDAITNLFGMESDDGDKEHLRGALMFWDVLPQLAGDSLQVEVMTPHQSHYYQQRSDAKSGDSSNPHDSGQPNPINFLTVPSGSRFTFHVQCDLSLLAGLAPELAEGGRWQALLRVAFEHAFSWLGFGAKTAVGYGAMEVDREAVKRRTHEQAARQARDAELAQKAKREEEKKAMSAADRAMADLFDERADTNQDERSVLFNALKVGKLAEFKGEVAQRLKVLMQEQRRWKEKSEKKNPEKDPLFQETQQVKKWLGT